MQFLISPSLLSPALACLRARPKPPCCVQVTSSSSSVTVCSAGRDIAENADKGMEVCRHGIVRLFVSVILCSSLRSSFEQFLQQKALSRDSLHSRPQCLRVWECARLISPLYMRRRAIGRDWDSLRRPEVKTSKNYAGFRRSAKPVFLRGRYYVSLKFDFSPISYDHWF